MTKFTGNNFRVKKKFLFKFEKRNHFNFMLTITQGVEMSQSAVWRGRLQFQVQAQSLTIIYPLLLLTVYLCNYQGSSPKRAPSQNSNTALVLCCFSRAKQGKWRVKITSKLSKVHFPTFSILLLPFFSNRSEEGKAISKHPTGEGHTLRWKGTPWSHHEPPKCIRLWSIFVQHTVLTVLDFTFLYK